MTIYIYNGFKSNGKYVKGLKESFNKKIAIIELRNKKIFVSKIKKFNKTNESELNTFFQKCKLLLQKNKISNKNILLITKQLSTLLKSSITITESLSIIIDQTKDTNVKNILFQIKNDINKGTSFAESIAKHQSFSAGYINTIKSGEESGTLNIVLHKLVKYMEKQIHIGKIIKNAMIYPIIMIIISLIIIIIMLTFVLPKICKLFQNFQIDLPLSTKILINISNLISNNWLFLILFFNLIYFLFYKWKNSKSGKIKYSIFISKIPILGIILKKISISKFTRTLASLIQSGIPILIGLNITKNIIKNPIIKDLINKIIKSLKEGENMANQIEKNPYFPLMISHMIAIGEKSGQIEKILIQISDDYEEDVANSLKTFINLIEPIMIILIGSIIGFIVFATLTPLIQISSIIK
jgi:general secretion pathway protein F